MTEQQFYAMVKEMREAQKLEEGARQYPWTDEYCDALVGSERAEFEVDQAIKEYFETNKNKSK